MLTRRIFTACALCGVAGFVAVGAVAQTPNVRRKVLTRIDGPVDGYETVIVEVECDPGFVIPRHTHPGIESSYVVEGGGELMVDGRPTQTLKAGDGAQIPPLIAHSAKIGNAKTRIIANLVVEKGKPLTSPA